LTTITITGSEGLIGKELCKFFKKKYTVKKLDLKLGHDLTDETFVKFWFKKNPTNYLVNCFALNDHVMKKRKNFSLFDFPLSSFSDYLDINLTSLFSVCREFARNNKIGTVVNFSSIYGMLSPRPDIYEKSHKDIAYGISKAGVINLTKYLSIHLAPKIRVNCVVPGGVQFNQDKSFIKNYSKLTPMKRMMQKNELNEIIDYLSSKKSSYVTGSVFVIDGGYTSW
jgi:NAD(P)-dependent dehydrogenase (short-subunit alcohol dehydrogenase family)